MNATGTAASRTGQNGMTLVELMIAMLIGTLLIAGALTVYSQSRSTFRTADSISRLQENARFALDTLEPDLRLARFWGLTNEPGTIEIPPGLRVSCAGTNDGVATILTINQLAIPVQVRDDQYDLGCAGSNPRNNSDVLFIRHASAVQTVPNAGQVQVQSNLSSARLFDDAAPSAIDPPSEIRDVVINIYYVGDSAFDPELPALRRLTLTDGGARGRMEDQEVIPGIENLQVQFGIDSDGDGEVDRYVDGDHPLAVAGSGVMAIRLWLLVRSEMNESGLGFVDTAVYQPADGDLDPIQPGVTPGYPAEFRRMTLSKTVFLRNEQS